MHSVAAFVGIAASVMGLIVLSFNFAYDERTQSIALVSQIVAIMALIFGSLLLIGLFGDLALKYHNTISDVPLSLHNLTGLTERVLLGIYLIWLIIIINNLT
ncbi:MAG: hypothetical protein Q8912_08895 [Bacillota bacterium]|nr:hypothetical protein [Bacillota bacterium]MDP4160686.1 hypothetical protein [Bacillota bacterium]